SDGHHREVRASHPHRRKREQRPGCRGEERGNRQRQPKAEFEENRKDRNRVGPYGVEADVAEGHLPRQAEQYVEPDADQGREPERRHDEDVIAVAHRGEGDGRCEGYDQNCEPHTFFNSERPKRPFGTMASATMTSVKVRICVYEEPRNAVMSDSTRP